MYILSKRYSDSFFPCSAQALALINIKSVPPEYNYSNSISNSLRLFDLEASVSFHK